MGAEEEILKSLARVENKLDRLLSASASIAATVSDTPTDTFSDDKLHADWADKRVEKDLPKWGGESMIGRLYSECPAEWHNSASGLFEWKAKKGREESPVRLKNNGKPWHEADTFAAKLHRTWAKRLRDRPAPAATREAEAPADAGDGEDQIPF